MVRSSAASSVSDPVALRRVLVVDDHDDARELLRLVLERAGHETRLLGSPSEAVQVALSFLPDVALIDIQMPELDGYQLAKQLRLQPELKQCRLIAISGHPGEKAIARSVAAGFESVWAKPISAEDVLALVAGRSRLRSAAALTSKT